MKKVIVNNELETKQLAENLGKHIRKGSVILLDGDLGVGKTTVTRDLAKSLGVRQNVSSPSFTILKSYEINENCVFNHLDLYRLSDVGTDFDLVEFIEDINSITVIEWPFNVESLLPSEYLLISIKYLDETKREFVFLPKGSIYEKVVDSL